MAASNIIKVEKLEEWNLQKLLKESEQEGHRFVRKLINEYDSGKNRFHQDGEVLYVATVYQEVVGICGLNIDPYNKKSSISRLRHLYVLSEYRNKGIARQLLEKIKIDAMQTFAIMTLRTSNPIADSFYRRNGFINDEGIYQDTTHYFLLKKEEKNECSGKST